MNDKNDKIEIMNDKIEEAIEKYNNALFEFAKAKYHYDASRYCYLNDDGSIAEETNPEATGRVLETSFVLARAKGNLIKTIRGCKDETRPG